MRVGQRELLHEVAREDGLVHVADVAVGFREVGVIVRARKPPAPYEVVEDVVDGTLPAEVSAVLAEPEGQDVHLPVASREQGGQVRAQQKGVGTREVDVPSTAGVEAVYGLLEAFAQLHLVDEEPVRDTRFPAVLYLAVQGVVLEEGLVVEVEQVDVDVVGARVVIRRLGGERLHELGLAATAHAGDNLDVPRALKRPETVHV